MKLWRWQAVIQAGDTASEGEPPAPIALGTAGEEEAESRHHERGWGGTGHGEDGSCTAQPPSSSSQLLGFHPPSPTFSPYLPAGLCPTHPRATPHICPFALQPSGTCCQSGTAPTCSTPKHPYNPDGARTPEADGAGWMCLVPPDTSPVSPSAGPSLPGQRQGFCFQVVSKRLGPRSASGPRSPDLLWWDRSALSDF